MSEMPNKCHYIRVNLIFNRVGKRQESSKSVQQYDSPIYTVHDIDEN